MRDKREARERSKQAEAEADAREEARLQAFHAQQQARFRSVSTASPPADMGRRRTLPKPCNPAQALTEPRKADEPEMSHERVPLASPANSSTEVRLAQFVQVSITCSAMHVIMFSCAPKPLVSQTDGPKQVLPQSYHHAGRWCDYCKLCWLSSTCCLRGWLHRQLPCNKCKVLHLPGDDG